MSLFVLSMYHYQSWLISSYIVVTLLSYSITIVWWIIVLKQYHKLFSIYFYKCGLFICLCMIYNNLQVNGLVQNCSISIVNALEILQSCTKPSKQSFKILINMMRLWYGNVFCIIGLRHKNPTKMDSPHKGPVIHNFNVMISLLSAWTSCWRKTQTASDLRHLNDDMISM